LELDELCARVYTTADKVNSASREFLHYHGQSQTELELADPSCKLSFSGNPIGIYCKPIQIGGTLQPDSYPADIYLALSSVTHAADESYTEKQIVEISLSHDWRVVSAIRRPQPRTRLPANLIEITLSNILGYFNEYSSCYRQVLELVNIINSKFQFEGIRIYRRANGQVDCLAKGSFRSILVPSGIDGWQAPMARILISGEVFEIGSKTEVILEKDVPKNDQARPQLNI
jgi:hypothetical protein